MTDDFDYFGIDMGGIPSACYSEVPAEAQKRLISAFPELRLLWNAGIKQFQLVYREPGVRQGFYGTEGVRELRGWAIIPGNYDPPLQIDRVIAECRMRENLAQEQARATGHANVADRVEALYQELVAQQKAEADAKMDDLLGLRPDGTVSPFGLANWESVISRPYHYRDPVSGKDKRLPTAPEWLTRRAFPATPSGPGAKELAKRARRNALALRGQTA